MARKKCGLNSFVKNVFSHEKQRYKCKNCGCNFTNGDNRAHPKADALRAQAALSYARNGVSLRGIAADMGRHPSTILRWIRREAAGLAAPSVPNDATEIEIDELWHFVVCKKNKLWVIRALDRSSKKIIAWVLGKRNADTVQKLYEKLKHLSNAMFYTDYWSAFIKVLPEHQHMVSKSETLNIERDNSNVRHRLACFKRKSKVVSRSIDALQIRLILWTAFYNVDTLNLFRSRAKVIYT